jgi:alkylation response protein AidB-like acyl-CoA dehydrogenase
MTEKKGGSDVRMTETLAVPHKGKFRLYGYKWFSSAT